ncbi:phenylalanine--tRNA ligase subunit beta [Mammaliicoccus vitulinus]|uniref:phenylalanine--tRNA ligase subunit beta n=1 Tax=Mammaliicoccus vitulinus TaxID=71237 RepID=UPI000D1D155F|nr:phenylalanine--tRNA ligase subunit beta [Mammaliicoccus vitulinus]PTI89704.1 phenylalanine--tRNA ligase subunit beta [Mammaliicoccus vitulinus]QQT15897.1 phenylalanine--tRNA ligase subunit beta [Mammaliicoccus vitulinus]QQY18806.1 phenylalanine--tRNA ligase subunit beta [Mammaliicoccus vitulinus]RTX84708.1 phenylalanine--tRNA ligase subunit beta [Mammaliicoccus vitulinus]GGH99687.1 phenylalanine--tRNA ligase beta subunit [Mammaliicoccus vitulinus]
MLVSKEWLNEYIKVDADIDALAEKITRSGIEVDSIKKYGQDIKKLVVGHVVSKEKHPEADKLNICKVDVGEEEPVQIVCGAPNVDVDQYVIVVRVGGRLPGGVKIKRAKLRGEVSEGMICSLQEIGLDANVMPKKYADGIYVFSNEPTPGSDALEALLLNDEVMDFDLTPNRADCLSMLGAAHEVSALYGNEIKYPNTDLTEAPEKATQEISVAVQNEEAIPYYAARVVKNVTIAPSPTWLQSRLMKAGIRPINNVVDISNYILLEYGQPLHMFDQDHIGSEQIVARYAQENEKITTLDGVERELLASDVVITNGSEPIAIAGVMGGDFSEVTDKTQNVVIESAIFNATNVRQTSRRLGLRSEASSRFEKGIASERVIDALNRAAFLLQDIAGGTVLSEVVSDGTLPETSKTIEISTHDVNQLIGFELSTEEINVIFNRLGFATNVSEDSFEVNVPSRRNDISIKADLIEEVARIYGYDQLPSTLPNFESTTAGYLTDNQLKTRKVKEILEGAGLDQAITYSLVHKDVAKDYALEEQEVVELMMPMSEDQAVLRQSLLPRLIDATRYNVARKNKNVALYELGRVFYSNGENQLPTEVEFLSGILTGQYTGNKWQQKDEPVDFFLVKGIVERIAEQLNVSFTFEAAKLDLLHPGRTAYVKLNDEVVGLIGELHPKVEKENDLDRTYVFELNFTKVLEQPVGKIEYEAIPRFPGVSRDIALVVNTEVTASTLISTINENGADILNHAEVFDVYEGEHMEEGKKSVAIRIDYLDVTETLTEEKVSSVHNQILEALEQQGATLRA